METTSNVARSSAARTSLNNGLDVLRLTSTPAAESIRDLIQEFLAASSDLERYSQSTCFANESDPDDVTRRTAIRETLLAFWNSQASAHHSLNTDFKQLQDGIIGVLKHDPGRCWDNPDQMRTGLIGAIENICKPWLKTKHCREYTKDALAEFLAMSKQRMPSVEVTDQLRQLPDAPQSLPFSAAEKSNATVISDDSQRIAQRVSALEKKAKLNKPPTKMEVLRNQRIKFCCSQIRKNPKPTWSAIAIEYQQKYPKDNTAHADTLRLSHHRNCEKCRKVEK